MPDFTFPLYILTGPRCSGKTTVAAALSAALSLPLFDTDAMVAEASGCSVADYIKKTGWSAFRRRESEALNKAIYEARQRGGGILSTGGGVVLAESNRSAMKEAGMVFYLRASVETLHKRMSQGDNADTRPALGGQSPLDEIAAVLAERAPLYLDAAHAVLEAENSPEEIIRDILAAATRMNGALAAQAASGQKKVEQ